MGLYRITKQGGVVVWVVGDQTVNGSESGTSFKHFAQKAFDSSILASCVITNSMLSHLH